MTEKTNNETVQEICQYFDENNVCSSLLEIQDIDFRVVRIEQKLDAIIRFLKRRVKPVLDDISEEIK